MKQTSSIFKLQTQRLNGGLAHTIFLLHRNLQSWISEQGNPLINWPQPHQPPLPPPETAAAPPFPRTHVSAISNILKNPFMSSASALHSALDSTGIDPDPALLEELFLRFDSSPKLLHSLFLWAEKKLGFQSSPMLFNSMVNALGKSREFEDAWRLILDRIGSELGLVSANTFAILIRRYARAAMHQAAIRTYEFAIGSKQVQLSEEGGASLFEVLLDSLCKEGHVGMASEYLKRKRLVDMEWSPTVKVYNILLNGWFRSRKLKLAERLWAEMKAEGVTPTVVTYGTLIEGYCRMRRVERAVELVNEMKTEGIEPNLIVYNPIIDAFGEVGRFKEALGILEHLMVCESGPDLATYNSLVKGYCKAKDLVGASKMLKVMIGRGFIPTATTYNYFFRHFSKYGKIEEAMNLYIKMVESGYNPDRLTYHLLLKMLCEEERLQLAVQVCAEMRSRGYDMDLATSTMLIHLLLKMHRFEEAFSEFEDMLRRGIVPQYLTFQRMNNDLRKKGMIQMAKKLCDMMKLVPHSSNLPNTYDGNREALGDHHMRRKSIIRKAEAMSSLLKTCNDPRELVKNRPTSRNAPKIASQLVQKIKRRVNEERSCE